MDKEILQNLMGLLTSNRIQISGDELQLINKILHALQVELSKATIAENEKKDD